MNENLSRHIEKLENRVLRLLEEQTALNRELERLRQEKAALADKLASQSQTMDHFQYQAKISKIVDQLAEHADASALQSQLDAYIAELDHCIAFLNQEL